MEVLHLQQIQAAKAAATGLITVADTSCKKGTLRDDSHAIAGDAMSVLKELEEKARSRTNGLARGDVADAAGRVKQALEKLQGRVATAARESQSAGVLGKLGLAGAHRSIFQEAREVLNSVHLMIGLEPLRSGSGTEQVTAAAAAAATTGAASGALQQQSDSMHSMPPHLQTQHHLPRQPQPHQQQQQQPQHHHQQVEQQLQLQQSCTAGPEPNSLPDIKLQIGSSLTALALVPGPQGSGLKEVVLWVGLNRKVEFYPTWKPKTELALSDKAHAITCIASDRLTGYVWTGHANGSVLLHAAGRWGVASLPPTQNGAPIRCMAVDHRQLCWAGDEAGSIRVAGARVVGAGRNQGIRLSVAFQDKPSIAAAGFGVGASGAAPVYAMLAHQAALFTSGGKWAHNLTLWNSTTHEIVDVHNCESFGAALCFGVLPWDEEVSAAAEGAAAAGADTGSGSWPGPLAEPMAHTGSASSSSVSCDGIGWRLLSGHEKGQVVLWQLRGLPKPVGVARALQQLAVIGEQQPRGAIRGMVVFPDYAMLVLAHESGNLTALPTPSAANGAAPNQSHSQQQQQQQQQQLPVVWQGSGEGGVGGPLPSLDLGAPLASIGGVSGSLGLHHWKPRVATIKAHKGGIVAATSWDELLVTASNRNVTPWTAELLRLEAQGDSLFFTKHPKPPPKPSSGSVEGSSSLSPAAVGTMVIGQAPAAATPGGSMLLQLQTSGQQQQQQQQLLHSQRTVHYDMNPRQEVQWRMHQRLRKEVAMQQHQHQHQQLPVKKAKAAPISSAGWLKPLKEESGELQQQPLQQQATAVQPPPLQQQQQPEQGAIKLHHVICSSELLLKEVIGSGAEGKVYRGTWTNIDIAAKEYRLLDDESGAEPGEQPTEAALQRARDALQKEVSMLTSLNHPNLVRFCGVCLDPPLLVMEFYRHGSIFSMLDKARRQLVKSRMAEEAGKGGASNRRFMNSFTWDRRLGMLHDIAAGMMYLHKRHYVHGDLRSPNLFVGSNGQVKIGDFGFAKQLASAKGSMRVKRVTHPRWVAPELLTVNRLSTASDVYSFAIVMHEMLTWQVPFFELTKDQVVLRVVSGERPRLPPEAELPPGPFSSSGLASYVRLMKDCWQQDPAKRPSFDRIAARLKAMIRWRMIIRSYRTRSSPWERLLRKARRQMSPTPSPASVRPSASCSGQLSSNSSGGSGSVAAVEREKEVAAATAGYPRVYNRDAVRKMSAELQDEEAPLYPELDYADSGPPPSSAWRSEDPARSGAFPGSVPSFMDPGESSFPAAGPQYPDSRYTALEDYPSSGYTAAEQYASGTYESSMFSSGPGIPSSNAIGMATPSQSRFGQRRIYSGISSMAADDSTAGAAVDIADAAAMRGVSSSAAAAGPSAAAAVSASCPTAAETQRPQQNKERQLNRNLGAAGGRDTYDVVEQAKRQLELWQQQQQQDSMRQQQQQQRRASADFSDARAAAAAATAAAEDEEDAAVGPAELRVNNEVMRCVINHADLTLRDVLSETSDGKIHRGTWCGIDIAAKQYFAAEDVASRSGHSGLYSDFAQLVRARNSLLEHVGSVANLNHPNLLRICGVCLDPPLVVTEYHKHTVFSMLQQARRQWRGDTMASSSSRSGGAASSRGVAGRRQYVSYLTWHKRLEMLAEIAAGMAYLHKWGYVRGDLRSTCLFVTSDGQVKVGGDLAYSRQLGEGQQSLTVECISRDPRWVAPEMMRHKRLSRAADVYSFAIVMHEMLTWQVPFRELSKKEVVSRVVKRGRPEIPAMSELPPGTVPAAAGSGLSAYLQLMGSCWDHDPDQRPTFDDISNRLKEIQQQSSQAGAGAGAAAASAAAAAAAAELTAAEAGVASAVVSRAGPSARDGSTSSDSKAGCSTTAAADADVGRSSTATATNGGKHKLQDDSCERTEAASSTASTLPMVSSPFAESMYLELPPLQLESGDISAPGTPQASLGGSGDRALQLVETIDAEEVEVITTMTAEPPAEEAVTTQEAAGMPLAAGTAAAAAASEPAAAIARPVPAATAAAAAAIRRHQEMLQQQQWEQQLQQEQQQHEQQLQQEQQQQLFERKASAVAAAAPQDSSAAAAAAGTGAALARSASVAEEQAAAASAAPAAEQMQPSTATASVAESAAANEPATAGTGTPAAAHTMGSSQPAVALRADTAPAAGSHRAEQPAATTARAASADAVALITPAAELAAASGSLQVPPPAAQTAAAVQQHIRQLEQLRPELGSQLLRLVLLHTLYSASNTTSTVQLYLSQPTQQQQEQGQHLALSRQQEMVELQLQLLIRHLLQFQQQQSYGWPELIPLLFSLWQLHARLSSWQQAADELLLQQQQMGHSVSGLAAVGSVDGSNRGSSSTSSAALIVLPALVVWWLCRMVLPVFWASILATATAGAVVWFLLTSWADVSGSKPPSQDRSSSSSNRQVGPVQPGPERALSSRSSTRSGAPHQRQGQAVRPADLAALSLSFPVCCSMLELPAGVKFAVQHDTASSTVGYTSWAVRLSETGTAAAAGERLLLLHTLPEHRYKACWQKPRSTYPAEAASLHGPAAVDAVGVRDQASPQADSRSTGSTAAVGQLVLPSQHPVLKTGVLSMRLPDAAFLRSLDVLLQLHYITQQQQRHGEVLSAAQRLFAPVLWLCLNPPMMLEALQPGSTLGEWLLLQQQQVQQQPYRQCSSSTATWQPPFAGVLWPQVLTWLLQVATILQEMHSRDVVHGGVHAGVVHLTSSSSSSSNAGRLVACLSLAAPWQHAVTHGRVVDPALAPPELQLYGDHPTGSPAVDTYGFGMLLWQVATGWVAQQQQQQVTRHGAQQGLGSDFSSVDAEIEMYEELGWCAEMMHIYSTTFPGVICSEPAASSHHAVGAAARSAAAAGRSAAAAASGDLHSSSYRDANEFASDPEAVNKHGCLPAAADGWLPRGYRQLMMDCCRNKPGSRPEMQLVCEQLQGFAAAMRPG